MIIVLSICVFRILRRTHVGWLLAIFILKIYTRPGLGGSLRELEVEWMCWRFFQHSLMFWLLKDVFDAFKEVLVQKQSLKHPKYSLKQQRMFLWQKHSLKHWKQSSKHRKMLKPAPTHPFNFRLTHKPPQLCTRLFGRRDAPHSFCTLLITTFII